MTYILFFFSSVIITFYLCGHLAHSIAPVVFSKLQILAGGLNELRLQCMSDVMWRKQHREKWNGFCAGFFGGLQKKERGREEPEAIEVSLFMVLVVWIWIKDWKQRRLLKMFSSPDAFCPLLGQDQSSFFSAHSLGIFTRSENRRITGLKWKPLDTAL